MDDFEQLGVTILAETPQASPGSELRQIVTVVVAAMLVTAVAVVTLAVGAGAIAAFLTSITDIQ